MTPRCDHKFIDGTACVKCGWKPGLTHFVAWDATGRVVTAYCGAVIRRRDHASEPTCPRCAALVAARESIAP